MKYVLACLMVVGFSAAQAQAQALQVQPVTPTTPTAGSLNKANSPRRSTVRRRKLKAKLDPSKICPKKISCNIGASLWVLTRSMQKLDARGKYTCAYDRTRAPVTVNNGVTKCAKVSISGCTKLLLAKKTKSKVFPGSGTRDATPSGGICHVRARVWFKQK